MYAQCDRADRESLVTARLCPKTRKTNSVFRPDLRFTRCTAGADSATAYAEVRCTTHTKTLLVPETRRVSAVVVASSAQAQGDEKPRRAELPTVQWPAAAQWSRRWELSRQPVHEAGRFERPQDSPRSHRQPYQCSPPRLRPGGASNGPKGTSLQPRRIRRTPGKALRVAAG